MALLAAALRREKGRAKNLAFASEAVRTVRCSECAERPRFYELRCERCQENRIHGQREKIDCEDTERFGGKCPTRKEWYASFGRCPDGTEGSQK